MIQHTRTQIKKQTREMAYVSFAHTYNIYVTCGDRFSWCYDIETEQQR